MGKPRVVGVDYGAARVGLAISDPLGVFAQPFGALPPDEAIVKLVEIDEKQPIARIVLGWPYELDGSEGAAVDAVRAFKRRIQKALPQTPISPMDERMTSREAVETISRSGAPRAKRREKGSVDSVAAAIILQNYLDENQD